MRNRQFTIFALTNIVRWHDLLITRHNCFNFNLNPYIWFEMIIFPIVKKCDSNAKPALCKHFFSHIFQYIAELGIGMNWQ